MPMVCLGSNIPLWLASRAKTSLLIVDSNLSFRDDSVGVLYHSLKSTFVLKVKPHSARNGVLRLVARTTVNSVADSNPLRTLSRLRSKLGVESGNRGLQ